MVQFHWSLRTRHALVLSAICLGASACTDDRGQHEGRDALVEPDFSLSASQTHSKFSRSIEPAVSVPSGSVVEAFTHEATGGQFDVNSSVDDLANVNMDMVHTLTGPVFVEDAEPGDTLAVELLEIEPADWGWMAIIPHVGLLTDDFGDTMEPSPGAKLVWSFRNYIARLEPQIGVPAND